MTDTPPRLKKIYSMRKYSCGYILLSLYFWSQTIKKNQSFLIAPFFVFVLSLSTSIYACEIQTHFRAEKPNDFGFYEDEDDDNDTYSTVEVEWDQYLNGEQNQGEEIEYPEEATGQWFHDLHANHRVHGSAESTSSNLNQAQVSISTTQFSQRINVLHQDASISSRGDI